jgi:hypothetical protein
VWLEGPAALGWHRWRECEEKYAYGIVERFINALIEGGYLENRAVDTQVRFAFWMLGGAGLALAEAPEEENRSCVTNGATSSAGRSPACGSGSKLSRRAASAMFRTAGGSE